MRRLRTLVCALLAVSFAVDPGAADKKNKKKILGVPHEVGTLEGPATLDRVNARWTGATTRTRVNIPIQKGKSKGWSSSDWLGAESETLQMRVSVGPRDELAEVLPKRNLLAGVTLVCEGWSVRKPKKGRGILIDFRFQNYPARARLEFDSDIEHLADIERFLRANVLGTTRFAEGSEGGAMESLPGGGASAPAVAPAEATAAGEEIVDRPMPAYRPLPDVETYAADATSYPSARSLRILDLEVWPERPRRGEPVELRVRYEVPAGSASTLRVHESRRLFRGSTEVGSIDESFERPPGRYTSVSRWVVPDAAIPGYYSYRARVSVADRVDESTVLFELE